MIEKLKNICKVNVLKYDYYDRIEDVPIEDWNSVNKKNNTFLSLAYLQTLEDTLLENIKFKIYRILRRSYGRGNSCSAVNKI